MKRPACIEEGEWAAAEAKAKASGRGNGREKPAGQAARAVEVDLINGATLEPEAMTWVWDRWLAHGKFHLIGGAPGAGKTTIGLALAATVSLGALWPDGTRCAAPGNVVIWSGEDDIKDTLILAESPPAPTCGASFSSKACARAKASEHSILQRTSARCGLQSKTLEAQRSSTSIPSLAPSLATATEMPKPGEDCSRSWTSRATLAPR